MNIMDIETVVFIALSLMNGSATMSIFFHERKPSASGIVLAIISLVILVLMVTSTFIGEYRINPKEYAILGLPFLLYCNISIWELYNRGDTHQIPMFINKMYIIWVSTVYVINGYSHYLFDK